MSKNDNEEAIINVKVNIKDEQIEVVEEEKWDSGDEEDSTQHYVIEKCDIENTEVIKFVGVAKDKDEKNENEDVKEIVEHVCGKCFKSYTDVNRLKRHLRFCKMQRKVNEHIEELESNLRKIEEEAEDLEKKGICFCCEENWETCHAGHIRCYECPKSFKNAKSFERHLFLLHSGIESYPCKTCNARCPTQPILEIHQKTHTRGKPFACKKCGKEFTRRYHLFRHTQYSTCVDSKPKKNINCKVCGKVFLRVDNLRNHLRMHLGEEPKNKDYQCPFCQKAFYGTATLNIHIRSHTGERPFPCDLCEKNFPSNAALRKHRRSHTGEKPYSCAVCEKCFAAKEVLNRHMKTHTGEKPHSCNLCGKSFIQATQLRHHMQNNHETSKEERRKKKAIGDKFFSCKNCNEKFNSRYLLSKHSKDCHSEDLENKEPLTRGTTICEYCGDNFKSYAGFKVHFGRVHKNVEFKCEICEEQFSRKADFNFHMLQHNDDEPQVCRICSEEFERKTFLFRHLKAVHKPEITKAAEGEDLDTQNLIVIENVEANIIKSEEVFSITIVDQNNEPIKLDLSEIAEPMEVDIEEEAEKVIDTKLSMDEYLLTNNIKKLLDLLLDNEILVKFGWPTANVENILREVIKNCGHTPEIFDETVDYATKMREYVKLLFTVVIDNDSIKELLNNHPIDEVIHQVLKIADYNKVDEV